MEADAQKKSVRIRIVALALLICAGTILLAFLAQRLFLERFYIRSRTKAIEEAYNTINAASLDGSLSPDAPTEWLTRLAETYNLQLIILDENAGTVRTTSPDPEFLGRRLWEKLLSSDILSAGGEGQAPYRIGQSTDERVGMSYLEAYGFLDNGNLFFMRTPLSDIRESVAISNRFLMIASIILVLIASLLSFIGAYRLTRPERLRQTIDVLQRHNRDLSGELRQKEEIDARRVAFLSALSHELKTPIALIQGYAEGIRDHVVSDDEGIDAYAEVIADEAKRMNHLVRSLAGLYELEEKASPLSPECFDLTAMIQNFLKSADILTKQKNVTVRFADYPPCEVYADPYQTQEVLQNYMNNALQHLDAERVVEIRMEQDSTAGTVRVSVFNSGQPVEEKHLDRLWEPFYKTDPARSRLYGGSGIGLSVVKAIQEAAGCAYGVINYENGVAFYFDVRLSGAA